MTAEPSPKIPRVVIIGGGFGGLSAAMALRREAVEVTLVDRQNHHLFQPLLYQVATAALSPADIAAPIRSIVAANKNTHVVLAEVTGIDRAARRVALSTGGTLDYDWLIVATGARHSYFGRDDWERHAPGIKTLDDATRVRRHVLLAMERAEAETDPERRKALLTFVVIGGGPTGVEMAGAIAELSRQSVSMDFRSITPHCARIVLIEAGERVLGQFPPALSAKARAGLVKLGVEVRNGVRVSDVLEHGVVADGLLLPAYTVVWAAGVRASPAAEWLACAQDRAGRAVVGDGLCIAGDARIFVIGDTAASTGPDGKPVPGIAPAAKQQGQYAARVIRAATRGLPTPPPFRYRHGGNLATVGRRSAVIDMGNVQMAGVLAWLVWGVAHVYFLIGFRSRLAVAANWLWCYATFGRSARLITGLTADDLAPATVAGS